MTAKVKGQETARQAKAAYCEPDLLVLTKYPVDADQVEQTCCDRSSPSCAGCAKAGIGSTCDECAGGFVKRQGSLGNVCVSCTDSAGWLNLDGKTCTQLGGAGCDDKKVGGQSSNQACCHCGGGHVTPTPFSYETMQFTPGLQEFRLEPSPRTADRYSLDEGCELASHNLTLDARTGVISVAVGRTKPTEPFDVECRVTAHQGIHTSYSSAVRISMSELTYGAPLLWFPSGASYGPKTSIKVCGEMRGAFCTER